MLHSKENITMKKIFNIVTLSIVVGTAMLYTSCDGDFEEINTDPDNPTEISRDLQIGFIERTLINEIYNYLLAAEAASHCPQHLSQPVYTDADLYVSSV